MEVAINCTEQRYYHLDEVEVYGEHKFISVDPQLTFGNQVPTELPHYNTYDTKPRINRFRVIFKYVKGGFPEDRLVQMGISTGEARGYHHILH
jgi:hypothetical protein